MEPSRQQQGQSSGSPRARARNTHTHSPVCAAQADREEMKLLSLLLAPVSRIHAYLSHIQVSRGGFESALFITWHKTKARFLASNRRSVLRGKEPDL